jgi:hypothetical protein
VFVLSCSKSTYDVPKPFYVKIDNFILQNDSSLGIEDVWINVNGNFVGVFEMPTVFPVISDGVSIISISPGIKVNGLNATRSYYPFYKVFTKEIDVEAMDTISILPQTGYTQWANISWLETFENNHKFKKSNDSDTSFVITYSDKFKGKSSGGIYLNLDNTFFESYTTQLTIPKLESASGMFLELNYKCNTNFDVGLYIYNDGKVENVNLMNIYSTDSWKKIYIDLYNPLLRFKEGVKYKIYISAINNDMLTDSHIFIDEFKIVQEQ